MAKITITRRDLDIINGLVYNAVNLMIINIKDAKEIAANMTPTMNKGSRDIIFRRATKLLEGELVKFTISVESALSLINIVKDKEPHLIERIKEGLIKNVAYRAEKYEESQEALRNLIESL